jgi:hypothetical protein
MLLRLTALKLIFSAIEDSPIENSRCMKKPYKTIQKQYLSTQLVINILYQKILNCIITGPYAMKKLENQLKKKWTILPL